ncbi:hypothetical protein HV077_20365 [Citrobacter freundii]|uniref:Uncharacterized protein n=1 Tax=Citrobacter freundii TaxID=546 RepID=A0A7W3D835_CITFR|nr:hypothetical protein [Citrobacter freundii]MBA8064689.1 hypothetical protein [Citrobacter freundii]
MKIHTRFSIKPIGLDNCSTIDFTKYSYVIKFHSATGEQSILHTENENVFSKDGHSLLHFFEYSKSSKIPLARCDIYCSGKITDRNIYINSFPNDNLSNSWTIFNKKFSKGETTSNSNYDKICNISNHRIFIDSQYPVGNPLDPFEKSKIERQLKARLTKPTPALSQIDYIYHPYPHQGESSLCGPATFFYALLKDNPRIYSQYIKDLWNSGKAMLGSIEVKPSQGCCHPTKYSKPSGKTRTPAIDWISMASLRDTFNDDGYYSPDDKVRGITMSDDIANWANAVGGKVIYNSGISYTSSWNQDLVTWLNNYISSDYHVAVLINDGLLSDTWSWNITPTHWIMWTGKLISEKTKKPVDKSTSSDTLVDLELFSWGEVRLMNQYRKMAPTLSEFCKSIYGAVIFKKIP